MRFASPITFDQRLSTLHSIFDLFRAVEEGAAMLNMVLTHTFFSLLADDELRHILCRIGYLYPRRSNLIALLTTEQSPFAEEAVQLDL